MRKIAIISEHASPLALTGSIDSGGQNIYVAAIARQLAREGYLVDVFTRRDNPVLPELFQWKKNLRVIHVPAGPARHVPKEELLPAMEPFGRYLTEFFRKQTHPYDIVHANFFMSGYAAKPAAKMLGIPLVMTFHALGRVRRRYQGDADLFPDSRFAIEDDLVSSAERIVAECSQDRSDLIAMYGADPERIDVVPCGFDPEELAPADRMASRSRLGWPQRRFEVLQLGRLVPRKGIDNVIRAIALLSGKHDVAARLYIVGGNSVAPSPMATPEIGRLSEVARQHGVLGQVVFVGRRGRQQLRYLYSAADVFVTTPWYEPFGITAVEAMACAVPVIGSAVGGLQTTIVDGLTGYLVEPDNAEALAARLALIARDSGARNILGEAGRQRANRLFTWSSVCRRLGEVYERALSSPRAATAPLTSVTPLTPVTHSAALARSVASPGDALDVGRALAARFSASAFARSCG